MARAMWFWVTCALAAQLFADLFDLGLAFRGENQAAVDADVTAWPGKGVDRGIVDDEEGETAAVALRGNAVTEPRDIAFDLRVVVQLEVRAHFVHEQFAERTFVGERKTRARRVAEIRQCDLRGGRGAQQPDANDGRDAA